MKEKLARFYEKHFGVIISEKRRAVMPVEDLRQLYIRKANAVTLNRAATKI